MQNFVTSSPCDELAVWWADCDELSVWRVDCVMSWSRDKVTGSRKLTVLDRPFDRQKLQHLDQTLPRQMWKSSIHYSKTELCW